MLGALSELSAIVSNYFETTPFDVMAAHALFFVGWVPILGVTIGGMIDVWQDYKEGEYWANIKWSLLAISIPQEAIQTPMGMENFFNNIAGSKSAITWKEKHLQGKFQAFFSFEIVSIGGQIQYYMRTPVKYRDLIEASIYAQYPEAQITEVEDYVGIIPSEWPNEEWDCWGTEMVLKKPDFLPIRTYEQFEHTGERDQRYKDTILPLLEMLGKMRTGEHLMIQFIIKQPDEQDWIKEGKKFMDKLYGRETVDKKKQGFLSSSLGWIPAEFAQQTIGLMLGGDPEKKKEDDFRMFKITPEERDQMEAVKEKITKLGWQTKIRFVYFGKHELFRKGTVASMMKGYFHQFGNLGLNKIGIFEPATPKDDYFWMLWQMPGKQRKLVKRYQLRHPFASSSPFMMNSAELATLFHFPSADSRTPVLSKITSRRSEAPMELSYAGEQEPNLPNMDRSTTDFAGQKKITIPKAPGPLAVPRPFAPTVSTTGEDRSYDRVIPRAPKPEELYQPKPGMPAPLPPGMESPENSMSYQGDAPPNLPI
ncbi:MAG: hypothetical protein WC730_02355 [Patescibacteria group bacterium]|jgi:hypothetical protein